MIGKKIDNIMSLKTKLEEVCCAFLEIANDVNISKHIDGASQVLPTSDKEPACQCRSCKRCGVGIFDP